MTPDILDTPIFCDEGSIILGLFSPNSIPSFPVMAIKTNSPDITKHPLESQTVPVENKGAEVLADLVTGIQIPRIF